MHLKGMHPSLVKNTAIDSIFELCNFVSFSLIENIDTNLNNKLKCKLAK